MFNSFTAHYQSFSHFLLFPFTQVCGKLPFDDSNHKELIRQVTKRGPQFSSTPEVSKEFKDLIVKMLTKLSRRITIDQIRIQPWYQKLAPPPEEVLPLEPDDPRRPMSRILKTTSTNIKVDKSRTMHRPSGSAPKISKSKDRSDKNEKKSSSYGQKVNGPPKRNPAKSSTRDHNWGSTADNPTIKANSHLTPKEYLSAVSAVC